jgi:hypothetical protein
VRLEIPVRGVQTLPDTAEIRMSIGSTRKILPRRRQYRQGQQADQ